MLVNAKRLYVNNPTKRIAKSGKEYYTFFTSLGRWNRGKLAGKSKGTLNCVTFLTDIELKPKMCILNVLGDLYVEEGKDKGHYFKLTITKFDTENIMKQPDIVDAPVDDFNDNDFKIPDIDEPIQETKEEPELDIPQMEEL